MKKKLSVQFDSFISTEQPTVTSTLSLAELQDPFEAENKSKGLRTDTLKFYKEVLESFYKFVPHTTPIYSITQATLPQFIQYSRDKGHADGTISTNMRGISAFLYWCMKQGYLPTFKITVPTGNTEPLETYEKEDIQQLLNPPDLKSCSFVNYVANIAVATFVFTGMRISTAVNIQIGDIDFISNSIYFRHTKNKKPHAVQLPQQLKAILKQYIAVRTQSVEVGQIQALTLFCNSYGDSLNANKLYKYIAAYVKKKGVTLRGVHSFRRFYIKTMILQGVPIPKIKHLVQHSSTDLLTHYAKFYTTDLADDVNSYVSDLLPEKPEEKQKLKVVRA